MPIKVETDEEYHAGEGVSKSGLWKLWTKTPYHFMYVEDEEKPHFTIGKAAHVAILEPETLESRVTRGPEDRRGNKWKEAQDFAAYSKTMLLTASDYDLALAIRDLAATSPELAAMRQSETIVETSAYHVDEETGVLVKTRPDMFNIDMRVICDIKNMADASADAFSGSIAKFGYHMQEALYSDVWARGSGHDVEAFFFVCFEKCTPPTLAVYELDEAAAREGHAIYRDALKRYAECERAGQWPAYPAGVQRIGLRNRWAYKMTTPPEGEA